MRQATQSSVSRRSAGDLDHAARQDQGRILVPALWMMGISLALFFLPVINGLIGGFVGGMKAGSVRNALIAAVLPAVAVAVGLWILLSLLGMPIIGIFAGTAIGIWILLSDLGLFIGAAIGGAMS